MADSKSPCKVSYNGIFKVFAIARPAVWTDFEAKIRTVYKFPPNVALDVQYKDEDGDVITLNTSSELDDVLATHTLFTKAPVKFNIFARQQEQQEQPIIIEPQDLGLQHPQPLYHSITSERTSTSCRSDSSAGSLTNNAPSWRRRHEDLSSTVTSDSLHGATQPPCPNSPCVSEHSEDGMLVSLDDDLTSHLDDELQGVSVLETVEDQSITYPQRNPVVASELQERLESYKLDAPVFASSLSRKNRRTYVEDETDFDETLRDLERSTSSHGTYPSAMEATLRGDVSATIEDDHTLNMDHLEAADPSTLLPRFEDMGMMRSVVGSVEEQHSQDQDLGSSIEEYNDAQEEVEPSEADPIELTPPSASTAPPSVSTVPPSVSTAPTPTSESHVYTDDRAFIELIQQFVKLSTDTIQSNPQLVARLRNILSKILSHAQIQVFIDFLTEIQMSTQPAPQPATQVQDAINQAAVQAVAAFASITAQVQEATSKVLATAQEAAVKSKTSHSNLRHPYSHHRSGLHRSMFGNHQSVHDQGPSTLMQSSPMMSPMHPNPSFATPTPPVAPIAPLIAPLMMPPVAPLIPDPLPALPGLARMPSMPQLSTATASSLGRSNTIHSSRPRPLGTGPSYIITPTAFKSDRFAPVETESGQEPQSASKKGKAKAADDQSLEMNSTASSVSGSSPLPPSSSVKSDSPPGQFQLPTDRLGWTNGKYGWVWNGTAGEKAEAEEAPGSSSCDSFGGDQSATPPPSSFVERPGPGPFRDPAFRDPAFRNPDRMNDRHVSSTEALGSEGSEGLRRRQTMYEYGSLRGRNGQTTLQPDPLDVGRARERLQQDIEQILEDQRALERRSEQAQQRLAGIRPHPVSQFGSYTSSGHSSPNNRPMGNGNTLSNAVNRGATPLASVTTTSTPVEVIRPPVAPHSAETPAAVSAPSPVRTPVAPTAPSPARTPAAVSAPSPVRAPVVTTAPSPARTPAAVSAPSPLRAWDDLAFSAAGTQVSSRSATPIGTVAVEANPFNPFADPQVRTVPYLDDEVRALVGMGFEDNDQLRQVIRENRGQIETAVEILLAMQLP